MSYKFNSDIHPYKEIHYDARTIRNQLKDNIFLEGIHYIRPFGGRKILFLWERIESDMLKFKSLGLSSLQ
ncbi:hypothetical protein G9F31_08985 [Acinetobacter sp. 187]|uniref:hypothetical protein n=1 Tax=Acinetobacter lanii TaxID=2715163 RepID=UPI00140DBEC6|nr:hypothetical protein [Acinetobacter lanii]NHC03902.1 hypothetical protein [Acinetobacter lanii]